MEWSWYDPERGEEARWWIINPETGLPNGEIAPDRSACQCLGDSVLDEVGISGDAIATTFATKRFSDDEVSALILMRVVPRSFQAGAEDAAELLDLVDGLWELGERCYQRALGRMPTDVEHPWLFCATVREQVAQNFHR